MSDQQNKDVKLLLLAGIIAAGVFTGALGSIQLLNANAQQQQQQQNPDDPMPVDLGCETGAEVCEEDGDVHQNRTTATTISTSGTATVKVDPDKFTVTVGVETNSTTTAEEAASLNADLTAKVIAALEALGISKNATSTSSYSVFPVYSSTEPVNVCRVMEGYPIPPECYVKQEITGYKASNSISVTLDADGDISAGKVIDAAIEGGANTVSGAYFFLSPERQLEVQQDLIEDAIANARHRADIAAGAVGTEITGIKSINLNDVSFPPFYYYHHDARAEDMSSSSTQILPGQQEVTMTVNVVYFASSSGNNNSSSSLGGTSSEPDVTGYMETARAFILSKLPGLGIEIDNELDLHTDMVVHVSENEMHLDYGVVDTNGGVHDGHIEVVNNEVTVATLDGQSIL
jgi:uncharacterized protein YggE